MGVIVFRVRFSFALMALLAVVGSNAFSASDSTEVEHFDWQHEGVLGSFDFQSIQRGLKVYKDVCAACHSLKLVPFRTLQYIGFSEDQVKAFAMDYSIQDGPNEDGEMFERPGLPSDYFPSPYPNAESAKASNNGALPPDLSLIVKARKGGSDYIKSLLLGYDSKVPNEIEIQDGLYYNKYFSGFQIAMAPPLSNGMVSYDDGTEATVDQMSTDVTNFLQWAAEPEMEIRKKWAMKTVIFMLFFTILFIVVKHIVWRNLYE